MTERMTLVQARVSEADARRLDVDANELGLQNRSEAVREGLRLLHRRARQAALAHDYDDFYGADVQVPVSELSAIGDQIAAVTVAGRPSGE
jgi:Arc/MetJ-type ribon-helix-helix transcriptional regulator